MSKPFDPIPLIARELDLPERKIAAVVHLLTEGATVPFIARYRKEATGDLDEVAIRQIEERHGYLQEFDKRRQAILASIEEQGQLTPELQAALAACTTKSALEDIYLPFKPKRRTRAAIARERGLEPLAQLIRQQPSQGSPLTAAQAYVNPDKGVKDAQTALAGARDILAEASAEDAAIRATLREVLGQEGILVSEAIPAATQQPTKYEQYYQFQQPIKTIPSHRFLAIRRGEKEEVLKVSLTLESDRLSRYMGRRMGLDPRSPFAGELSQAIADGYQRLLFPSVANEWLAELKERSDTAAIEIFAKNLRGLLLSAPLGGQRLVGIDPGLRTGCKCVAVDATGNFLGNITIYPEKGAEAAKKAAKDFLAFVKAHQPTAIAIGNGTGGRETERFARQALGDQLAQIPVIQVNEAGASVYSASELARAEYPDLDLTVRGAISIAHRLQDPLAELVKIDPKSIGVGQYQHDVSQPLLQRKLGEVVESCVNHVGVDLNTASPALLSYVAGIGPNLARKIVQFRQKQGRFASRKQLLKVPGLGPRAFEQAAGFLRLRDGQHPLDASAVHPERYPLVERIAQDLGLKVAQLVGNAQLADRIPLQRYIGPDVGELTLKDIVAELKKPGRDPRDRFEPPQFRDDVHSIQDLQKGMEFEGIVTNVTAFGAFVDIGVHQDGLVHISQLADRYVKDPNQIVTVGDHLKVRVLEVDRDRNRIQLTAKKQGGT